MPKVNFNKAKFLSFFLFLIIAFSFFLRVYKVQDLTRWDDSARDLLVAKHFVSDKKIDFIAPVAAGFNSLKNSPLYYLVIASFWFLTDSVYGVVFIFVLIGTLTVYLNYQIGKNLGGIRMGLFAAMSTALSPAAIEYSRSVFQPHLIPFFVSSCILTFLLARKHKSWFYLCCSIITFFLGLHIHYSIIVLLPILSIWWYLEIKKLYLSNHSLSQVLLVIFTYLSQIILFFSVTQNMGEENQIFSCLKYFYFYRIENILNTLSLISWHFLIPIPNYFSLTIYLFIIAIFLFINKKRTIKFEFVFLLTLFASVIISTIAVNGVLLSYVSPFMPITILISSYLFSQISKKHPLIIIVFLVFCLINFNHQITIIKNPSYDIKGSQRLVNIIVKDYRNIIDKNINFEKEAPQFIIAERCSACFSYNWFSPTYWFHAEDVTHSNLVDTTTLFNNIQPINDNPLVVYLVCRDYQLENAIKNCAKKYIEYSKYNPDNKYAELRPFYQESETNLYIFRLPITKNSK